MEYRSPLVGVAEWEQWLNHQGYSPPYRWTSLAGGMNNQAYRLEAREQTLCLKHYLSPQRLEREFQILSLLAHTGWTPKPILQSPELKLGLYEFLEGCAVTPTKSDCLQAFQFLESMQPLRHHNLSPASDACLEPVEHWRTVQARLSAIHSIFRSDWKRQWGPFLEQVASLTPTQPADACELVLSPSDFGFHNALRRPDGKLQFFDLEYAGLDDPAKVVCDFFAQPRLPAPLESLTLFVDWLSPPAQNRLEWMWPVTAVKWACIVLKERSGVDPAQQWSSAEWLIQRYSLVASRLKGSHGLLVNGPRSE